MRVLLAATALVAATVTAAAPAHAYDDRYRGHCSYLTTNSALVAGGADDWGGVVSVHAVATDPPGAPISATCEILVNGVGQGVALASPEAPGVTAAAGPLSFHAGPFDVVDLCTRVTVAGVPQERDCPSGNPPSIGPVDDLLTTVFDLLTTCNSGCGWPPETDPVTCARLAPLAPGAGPVVVSPEGDVWVGGTAPENKVWDCPPYDAV